MWECKENKALLIISLKEGFFKSFIVQNKQIVLKQNT